MENNIHIIVAAGDGRSRSLVVKKRVAKALAVAVSIVGVILVVSLYLSYNSLAQQRVLMQLESEVQRLSTHNSQLLSQVCQQESEKQELLSNAVNNLNERSSQIESILTKVGIEIPASEGDQNSGGPYIADMSDVGDGSEDALFVSQQLIGIVETLPLGIPCEGYLSSSFGARRDPFNGRRAFHSGIDIAHYVGTKVYATASGTVTSRGAVSGYGNMVKVANGDRFMTVFGHLDKILVKRGQQIARGDVIGTMGNTGRSTGPHLHYEIRDQGNAINPYSLTYLAE